MTGQPRYWHGGVPDLRAGDLIRPGSSRRPHEGCPFCDVRASGLAIVIDGHLMDGPSAYPDRVYLTTDREYARHYASLYGRGDLYRVEPVGPVEDHFETVTAKSARVLAVYDRAVLLTPGQRKALHRRWAEADRLAAVRP